MDTTKQRLGSIYDYLTEHYSIGCRDISFTSELSKSEFVEHVFFNTRPKSRSLLFDYFKNEDINNMFQILGSHRCRLYLQKIEEL